MEKHKTVLDFLNNSRPELVPILEELKPKERISKIQEIFLSLINHNKDNEAVTLFQALMYAVDDEMGIYSRKTRVEKARKLFEKLSKLKYCSETKKAVFREISSWWKETKDETEADKLFDFIVEKAFPAFYSRGEWRKEWDEFLNIIKEITDLSFSRLRLLRHIVILLSNKDGHVIKVEETEGMRFDIFKVMLSGCIRNFSSRDIGLVLKAVEPMFGEIEKNRYASLSIETLNSAFDVLREHAEKTAKLCQAADVLRKDIENPILGIRFSPYVVGYHNEHPIVLITITDSNVFNVHLRVNPIPFRRQNLNTEHGEIFFNIAKDFLLKWLEKNCNLCNFKCLVLKLAIKDDQVSFYEKECLINL